MFRNIPPVTRNIIIANILILILMAFDNSNTTIRVFALFSPVSGNFHIWQLITYMFLHGGFWHIFFNMYALMVFGSALENVWGGKRYLLFYIACGIGAALCHILLVHSGVPTVGASGAIYGILIGYAMLYPESMLTMLFPPISLKAKWFACIFAGIELLMGVLATNDGVAHFAHLGGMLVGLILILYWKKKHTMYGE